MFENCLLRATKVDYFDEDYYQWFGETYDGSFKLTMIKDLVGYRGSIYDFTNSQFYRFFPLNKSNSILFEYDNTDEGTCTQTAGIIDPEYTGTEDCDGFCEGHIDILLLLTPEAQDWLVDEEFYAGFFELLFAELEQTFMNSNIPQSIGYKWVEFDWSNNMIETCQQNAIDLSNNLDAQSLRLQNNSDLVLLLAPPNTNWTGANDINLACVAQVSTDFENAYGIIPIDKSFDNFIFTHEVGHLFGCQHQPIPQDPNCDSGYSIVVNGTDGYSTIMAIPNTGVRIPFFSNPEVSYLNIPIGDYNIGYSAGKIREVGCEVGNHYQSDDIEILINVTEDNCLLNLEAIVSPSNPDYEYVWNWTLDGLFTGLYPSNLLGMSDVNTLAVEEPINNNCDIYFIQLEVILDGEVVATKVISQLAGICIDNVQECDEVDNFQQNQNQILKQTKANVDLMNETTIENIHLFNMQGKKVLTANTIFELRRKIKSFPTGVYILFSKSQNGDYNSKKIFHQYLK